MFTIKTQVIQGFSDHNAVFVEGDIKLTINKQIHSADGSLI